MFNAKNNIWKTNKDDPRKSPKVKQTNQNKSKNLSKKKLMCGLGCLSTGVEFSYFVCIQLIQKVYSNWFMIKKLWESFAKRVMNT